PVLRIEQSAAISIPFEQGRALRSSEMRPSLNQRFSDLKSPELNAACYIFELLMFVPLLIAALSPWPVSQSPYRHRKQSR
ncbi:MAG: hypothetical protein AAF622_18855, partial [Cyanobacteria bacterium P01_C01_bin.147]